MLYILQILNQRRNSGQLINFANFNDFRINEVAYLRQNRDTCDTLSYFIIVVKENCVTSPILGHYYKYTLSLFSVEWAIR